MPTFVEKLKSLLLVRIMKMLGYRQVPDFKLQVIERHGRYHRVVGDTYVKTWSPFEKLGRQIEIGLRVIEKEYKDVMSRDGVSHTIKVSTRLLFDLRETDPDFAPIIVEFGEWIINERAASLIDLALRPLCGRGQTTTARYSRTS